MRFSFLAIIMAFLFPVVCDAQMPFKQVTVGGATQVIDMNGVYAVVPSATGKALLRITGGKILELDDSYSTFVEDNCATFIVVHATNWQYPSGYSTIGIGSQWVKEIKASGSGSFVSLEEPKSSYYVTESPSYFEPEYLARICGGGGGGGPTEFSHVQAGHGFSEGDLIYFNGSTAKKAVSDFGLADSIAQWVVNDVVSATEFKYCNQCEVSKLTGYTPGTYLWTSTTPGGVTNVQPTATNCQFVGVVRTAGAVYMNIGDICNGGGGGGGGTDDQTAAEVPFTPGGKISATDVQNALLQVDSLKGGKIGSNVITARLGVTREWRLDTCTTNISKGNILLAAIAGTSQDAYIFAPPDTFEVSTPVTLKGGQVLVGFAKKQTMIRGVSSHGMKFPALGAAYRVGVFNVAVESLRSVPGSNWDAINFEDKTGTPTGVITLENIAITESDRDGIRIGKNWSTIYINDIVFTDRGDMDGYAINSNGQDVMGTFHARTAAIKLDSFSLRNRLTGFVSYNETDDIPIINLGTDNSYSVSRATNMLLDSIGGEVHMRRKDFSGSSKIRAYYPLDRANYTNGVIYDKSGNLAHGYSSGSTSPTVVNTPWGEGLHFDGVDDFIDFPSPNSYADGKFYCSFLMYADNTTTGTLVYQGSQFVYRYNAAGSTFQTFQTTGSASRTVTLAEKKWYHVGIVLNGTNYEVWINGVLSQSSATTTGVKTGVPGRIYIGSQNGTTSFFKGTISQLLFVDGWYSGIEREAFTNAVLKKGLQFEQPKLPELLPEKVVAYYPLVNTSGIAYDYSDNQLNGTITGTLSNVTTAFGGSGKDFNGSSNKVTVADNPIFDMQNFYMSALVSWDVNASRRVFYKQGTLELSFKTDGIDASIWRGGVESKAEFTVAQNVLYHVGIGVKNNIIYLTLNGQVMDTTAFTGSIDTSANAFIIGAQNSTSYWDGLIDEVVILNDFSPELARQVYKSVTTNKPFLQRKPNPVGYTVATLPKGVLGMRAFVTDAVSPTYLGTLTGGGTVVVPVFFNGTAWVSH